METVRTTLQQLKSTADREEATKLCSKLLDLVNHDKNLLSGAMMLLVADDSDQKTLLHIFRQVGKLDILQLMADILSNFRLTDFHTRKLITENRHYWRDLVAAASNASDLRNVIEILYHMNDGKIILEIASLVTKLKPHWQRDDLMHGTVKLLQKLVQISSVEEKIILVESGALSTLSVLFGLLMSKNPKAVGINFAICFPYNAENDQGESVITKLAMVTHDLLPLFECDKLEPVLKTIRSLIPLLSHTLNDILTAGIPTVEMFAQSGFFHDSICLLTFFMALTSTPKKDVKLIISSKIMEELVVVLNEYFKYTPKCCPSVCCKQTDCLTTAPITRFINLWDREKFMWLGFGTMNLSEGYAMMSNLSRNDRISLFFLMEAFLKSGDYETLTEPKLDVAVYAGRCLTTIFTIVQKDSKSNELRELFSSPNSTIISTIIDFTRKNEFYLGATSALIWKIIKDFEKTSQLIEQVIPFAPVAIGINRDELVTLKGGIVDTEWLTSLKTDLLLFDVIVLSGSLSQLQAMEESSLVIDILIDLAFNLSQCGTVAWHIVSTFIKMVRKWDLNLFTLAKFDEIIPHLSKKMELSKSLEDTCRILIYNVGVLLPKSHNVDLSELEPFVIKRLPLELRSGGVHAHLLKLVWEMVKCPKHKLLFKELSKLSCNTTVQFASPGNTELAKIFQFISNLIVECIESGYTDTEHGTVTYLTEVTKSMVSIARSQTLDEELYVLEDMVSPAMWLLEKQNDEKIFENVKEFIRILHYD